MSKGIVIEMKGQTVLIMTPDGQFKQVAKQDRSYQLGEEISYVETINRPSIKWRFPRPFAIAAASVFCIMLVALLSIFGIDGLSTNKVAAYVTMDINPSVEVGIDNNENVIEIRGINGDGEALIKDIVYKGLSLDAFSDLIVERIERGHYLDSGKANIIISSTVMKEAKNGYEVELAEKVKTKFMTAISKTHASSQDEIVVTAITAPKEVRKEAITQGVSTGKKAIQLLTQNNNTATTDEDLKNKPIQQIITENGGIDLIIPKDRNKTKEQLKSLLNERNEKKQDLQKNNSNKDGSNKENSKKDDSRKDNSRKDNSKKDNSRKDNSKKEDSKKEDSRKEDSKKEDSKKDDSKRDDSKKEDSKMDNSKKDDNKKDNNKNDDSKKGNSKKNDSKNDDSKKNNGKSDDNKKDTKKNNERDKNQDKKNNKNEGNTTDDNNVNKDKQKKRDNKKDEDNRNRS